MLMSQRFIPLAALGLACSAAWADSSAQNTGAVSEANEVALNNATLKDETVALKPQVGVLNFQDGSANQTQRGAVGLALDLNFSTIVSGVSQNVYFGVSTGGLYSHIGEVGSNFFGSNSSTSAPQGTGGGNLALFPVDAKLGYSVTDALRISAHGGGNVVYNSIPSTINWGSAQSRSWNLFPNVGGDVDLAVTKNVELTLRPDWSFTPGVGFFTGTLEFGFALG